MTTHDPFPRTAPSHFPTAGPAGHVPSAPPRTGFPVAGPGDDGAGLGDDVAGRHPTAPVVAK
jgi:hypothetical protein